MKKQFLSFLSLLMALASSQATVPVFYNYGVTNHPQIDAEAVVNYGTIQYYLQDTEYVQSGAHIPFETLNTRIFTNHPGAYVEGSVGFRFYNYSDTGRRPMDTFVNRGSISVIDPYVSGFIILESDDGRVASPTSLELGPIGLLYGTYIDVSSKNIKHSGLIEADRLGLIRMNGVDMDLTRGAIRSANVSSELSDYGFEYGFFGRDSRYYNDGTNYINPSGILDGQASVRSNIIATSSLPGGTSYLAFTRTNATSPTNFYTQVVFVQTNRVDTNIVVDVRFTPPMNAYPYWIVPDPTADGNVLVVQFGLISMDVITGKMKTNYVHAIDFTAMSSVQTNFTLETNLFLLPRMGTRPTSYETTFVVPSEWRSGLTNNTVYTNTLLSGTNYMSPYATNIACYYTFEVGNPTAQETLGGGSSSGVGITEPTNWPGRIELRADKMNLSHSRMYADSTIYIKATNLIANTNLLMDAPHIYVDIGSPTGLLCVSNFVPAQVSRFNGTVRLETHFYTNYIAIVDTNAPADTNTVTPEQTTNTIEVKTHVFIVDHSNLRGVQSTRNDEVFLRANNVVNYDNFNATSSLLIDAINFRNYGLVSVYGKIDSLGIENFPRLGSFTNEGTWSVPNLNRLGSDRPSPLNAVINRGVMTANNHQIAANSFENSGVIQAQNGPVSITASAAKLDQGTITAAANLDLSTSDLKMRDSTLYAGGINLSVSGNVSDGGSNFWITSSGIQLLKKPAIGDFLGLTLTSSVPMFADVMHQWAGQERGNQVSGYSNNAAIGHLVLVLTNYARFSFQAPNGNGALYVDYLELKNFDTNSLADSLNLANNFRVYFATSNIPAEVLDGKLNGRLRWCYHYAGAYSQYPVVDSRGNTNYYNGVLRYSTNYDSDGDGIANANDTTPFEGVDIASIVVSNVPTRAAYVSWYGATQIVYNVQFATNLNNPRWTHLGTITNSALTNGPVYFKDVLNPKQRQKYYRIHYLP